MVGLDEEQHVAAEERPEAPPIPLDLKKATKRDQVSIASNLQANLYADEKDQTMPSPSSQDTGIYIRD